MNILHVGSCEIVEIRDSADAVGYSGPRTANAECSDCGSELCESHTETCGICHSIFCPATLVLPSSRARKARLSGSRTTFGSERAPSPQRLPEIVHFLNSLAAQGYRRNSYLSAKCS